MLYYFKAKHYHANLTAKIYSHKLWHIYCDDSRYLFLRESKSFTSVFVIAARISFPHWNPQAKMIIFEGHTIRTLKVIGVRGGRSSNCSSQRGCGVMNIVPHAPPLVRYRFDYFNSPLRRISIASILCTSPAVRFFE